MGKGSMAVLYVGLLLAVAGLILGTVTLFNVHTPEHREFQKSCEDAGGVVVGTGHCVPVIHLKRESEMGQ